MTALIFDRNLVTLVTPEFEARLCTAGISLYLGWFYYYSLGFSMHFLIALVPFVYIHLHCCYATLHDVAYLISQNDTGKIHNIQIGQLVFSCLKF